jgi:methyltransferase family protein
MGMKTLDEIAIANGADKGSTHPVKGHDFARHYDRFFAPLRFDKLQLLEIGVGGGESIRTWLQYFPSAYIYGVDIVSNTNPWNTPDSQPDPRYRFLQGDQTDKTMWACLCANWGTEFDIIVDDGGHFNDGIITAFSCMWDCITPGGLYCVEDLGSGYTPGSVHVKPGFPPHSAWLHAFVDALHTSPGGFDSAYFAPELVIIRKRG